MNRTPLILGILLLWGLNCLAQQTFTGHVIDKQTGKGIPFASVYVSEDKGTIANEEGTFTITLEVSDSIRVSSIGYTTITLGAKDVPNVISLSPYASTLQEVTVLPIRDILDKIIKRLNKDFIQHNRTKSVYFLRQTISHSDKSDITEAFLSAFNSVCLRNIKCLNGQRYKKTQWTLSESSLLASNLQHLIEMGPRVCEIPFWQDATFPLGTMRRDYYWSVTGQQRYDIEDDYPYCLQMYSAYIKSFTNAEGREIYEIHIHKKASKKHKSIVNGIIYVDAKDYSLLQFEGNAHDLQIDISKDFWTTSHPANIEIHSHYTHRRGFTEVEYVACTLEAAGMKCRSIAYNLGKRKIKTAKGKKVKLEDNLLDAIDRAGYDSTLWQQTCIQRTEEEERIVRESMTSGDTTAVEIAREAEAPAYRPDSLAAASGSFRPLVERLRAFGRTIPQEKVYVHMDNTCYQLGDTIWFTAYTRRTDTGRPSDVSGLLYVELYGQEGYLVQMHDGQGEGFFALDHLIQYAGLYELRAYTRWQLNWGGYDRKHSPWAFTWFESKEQERAYFRDYAKLYSRVFPVYDRPKEPGEFTRDVTLRGKRRYFRRDRDKHELTLTLFPEGGTLVTGLPCRMAFEAAWDDGQWVDGWLHYGQDSARVVNRGRGTITFTPSGKKKQNQVKRLQNH